MTFEEYYTLTKCEEKGPDRLAFVREHEENLKLFSSAQLSRIGVLICQQKTPRLDEEYPAFENLPRRQRDLERSLIMAQDDLAWYQAYVTGQSDED